MSNTLKTISNDELVTATGGGYIAGGGVAAHPLLGSGLGLGLGGFGGLNNLAAVQAQNNQNQQTNNMMMMGMAMAMANRPHYF